MLLVNILVTKIYQSLHIVVLNILLICVHELASLSLLTGKGDGHPCLQALRSSQRRHQAPCPTKRSL